MDMEKLENRALISDLGYTEMVYGPKKTNCEYMRLTAVRSGRQVAAQMEPARAVRMVADVQYDEIQTRAFVANVAAPIAESLAFITHLNKLINDIKIAFKQRGSRRKEEKIKHGTAIKNSRDDARELL